MKKRPDPSDPKAKLALVALLLFAGFGSSVLTLEAIRTSTLATAYLAALALMVASTAISLGRSRRPSETSGEPEPRPEPPWHVHRTFTDPLFQGPAVFCAFVLVVDLLANLAAEPPRSPAGVWLLWTAATATVLVLLLAISRPQRRLLGPTPRHRPQPSTPIMSDAVKTSSDPWFSIPGGLAALVVVLGQVLELVEEHPSSAFPWLFVLAALVVGAAAATHLARDFVRKELERFSSGSRPR
jgi:hypothetical protein